MNTSTKKRYYREHADKWRVYNRNRAQKYPLYAVWHGILVRCGVRPGAKDHDVKNYIERGISVCEEWRSYANFESWALANGWQRGLQIDRVDVNGNYEPTNCRFVTASMNQRNRRNTIFVVYNGKRMPLADAYDTADCKINYRIVVHRVSCHKWPVDVALTRPVEARPYRRKIACWCEAAR